MKNTKHGIKNKVQKIPTIDKPCIRQCCLNEDDICMGCFRTLDDMKIWHKATQNEKMQILQAAFRRKKS